MYIKLSELSHEIELHSNEIRSSLKEASSAMESFSNFIHTFGEEVGPIDISIPSYVDEAYRNITSIADRILKRLQRIITLFGRVNLQETCDFDGSVLEKMRIAVSNILDYLNDFIYSLEYSISQEDPSGALVLLRSLVTVLSSSLNVLNFDFESPIIDVIVKTQEEMKNDRTASCFL